MRFTGKTAVVTGGAGKIGSVIVRRLAEEGADVVIADIDVTGMEAAASAAAQYGTKVIPVKCDVSHPEEITAMMSRAAAELGHIDILVNCAGVFLEVPMLECTLDDWNKVQDTNIRGVMLCTQEACRVMKEQNYGRIVNISSTAAFRGRIGQQAYCASRGFLQAFTKSIGLQMARYGITINTLALGTIDTGTPEAMSGDPQKWAKQNPSRRLGTPEDVAGPVLFFAGDDSSYVNGTTVAVDGGMAAFITGVDF